MPLFTSKVELTNAASSSKIVLADVDLIKGAFKVYPSLSTIQGESLNYFADKQIVMAGNTSRLYQATITPADFITVFEDSASFTEFTFTGLSADVPSGTISGSTQISAFGYVLSSQTASFVLSSQTSSFALQANISGAFTSVSSSVSTRLTTLEGTAGGSTDITALNLFTGSAQTSLTALNSATSSYLTSASTGSFILASQTSSMSVLSALTASFISSTFISASAAASGFGTATLPSGVLSASAQIAVEISGAFTEVSGGLAGRITTLEATSGGDVTALNLFTSSIQTQVDNLTAETSSYLTAADTASFIVASQTSSMSVLSALTASFISDTFISASAAASGFGSGGGSINTDSFATTGSNTFKGEQIISSSLIVTNEIKGTGSIFLQPDVNDGRKLEIYNTAATDVHIKSNGGLTFLGDDTNYVLVDNSAAQTVSITGVNGVFVNSSLNVSGSLIVTGSINVPGSVINNLTSSFATTASFISDLFISASAVRSGFGTALFPSGLLSSSFQIANDISGAFTSLSSSFASRITALEGAGGGNGIFTLTGSFYSTTNNIQITGSLSVGSGSFKSFEVDSDGFVVLGDMDKDLNNAPEGTIAYSGSSFYLIT
jgi:hypothetical protein